MHLAFKKFIKKHHATELVLVLCMSVFVFVIVSLRDKDTSFAYPFITPRAPDVVGVFALYRGIATGDLNNDGILDIVASPQGGSKIAVFMGTGGGAFLPVQYVAISGNMPRIYIYDVNGDGKNDIVGITTVSRLYTVLGDGVWATVPLATFTNMGFVLNKSIIKDIDHDGIKDIAGISIVSRMLYVFKGQNAAPYFNLVPTSITTSDTSSDLESEDINNDSIDDIFITKSDTNLVSRYSVDSSLAITFSTNYPTGATPSNFMLADTNNDSRKDLAIINTAGNSISILLQDAVGNFITRGSYSTGLASSQIIALDVNGDGFLDFAVTNSLDSTVSVLVGNGLGDYSIDTVFAVGGSPVGLLTADFNGDGIPDIATANAGGRSISILTNTPQPSMVFAPIGGALTAYESGGTINLFTALLGKIPTAQVDVTLANLDGQLVLGKSGICFVPDVLSLPGTGSNAPCTVWSDPQIVTVSAIDDLVLEGVHTGVIRASAASADIGYNGLQGPLQNVTITDNDTANLIVHNSSTGTVNEGGATGITFNVSLGTVEPTADVTVSVGLTSPDPANIRLAVDVATICFTNATNNTPGCVMWNTSAPVTITPISLDDTTYQTNQDYSVILNTVSTDLNYNTRTGVVFVGWRDNDATPSSDGGGSGSGRKFGVTQPIMVALNETYNRVAENPNAVNNYLASVSALQAANSIAKQSINKEVIAVLPAETNEIIIEEIIKDIPRELVARESLNELIIPNDIIEKEINIIRIPRVALEKPYIIKSVIPIIPKSEIRSFEISETKAIPVDMLAMSGDSRDLACKYGTNNIYTQHDGREYIQDNTDSYHKKYPLQSLCEIRGEFYTVNDGNTPERNIAMNQDEDIIPRTPIKAGAGPLASIPMGTTLAFGGLTTLAVVRKRNKIQQLIDWIGNMV